MKTRKRRGRRSLMAAVLCLSLVAAQAAPTVYAARTEAGQRQGRGRHFVSIIRPMTRTADIQGEARDSLQSPAHGRLL